MNIGFIGLGKMGAPMMANLLRAGYAVFAYDISTAAVDTAVKLGAVAAVSPAAVARNAELVITVLPSQPHVEQVYLGDNGVLAGAHANTLLLDCSTTGPRFARELSRKAEAKGFPIVDAPVSGGTQGAAAATLTFLLGADAEFAARVDGPLRAMGKEIILCGGLGAGQAVKVCNNLLLAVSMIATGEAMTLGVKLGVDPFVLANAINASTGRCWSSEKNNPWPGVVADAPASNDYAGGGSTDTVLKDLMLATESARDIQQPVVLASLAQQLYQSHANRGSGDKDFSSIIKLFG